MLSESEVTRLLSAPMSLKMRAVLMTLYSAALRLSEGTHLRPADIDSGSMVIRIRQPKGGRDRAVMLSIQLSTRCGHTGGSTGPARGSSTARRRSDRSPRAPSNAVEGGRGRRDHPAGHPAYAAP